MKPKPFFTAWLITGVLFGLTACGAAEDVGQMSVEREQELQLEQMTMEREQTQPFNTQDMTESQPETTAVEDISENVSQDTTVDSSERNTVTENETTVLDVQGTVIEDSDGVRYEKAFGSYLVLDDWVEAEAFSSKDKFFYVKAGEEEAKTPDNVSINIGTNRYAAEDHMQFRQAIMAQLLRQIGGAEGISLTGSGSQTDNGDILYQFTITEEGSVVTTQYYIVGEYQFCLIQETNFTQSEEADKVAKKMVDSFVWSDV